MDLPYFLTEQPYFEIFSRVVQGKVDAIVGQFDQELLKHLDLEYFVAKYLDLDQVQQYRFLVNMSKLLDVPVTMESIAKDAYQQILFCMLLQYYFSI
jgi:hypothetical protein